MNRFIRKLSVILLAVCFAESRGGESPPQLRWMYDRPVQQAGHVLRWYRQAPPAQIPALRWFRAEAAPYVHNENPARLLWERRYPGDTDTTRMLVPSAIGRLSGGQFALIGIAGPSNAFVSSFNAVYERQWHREYPGSLYRRTWFSSVAEENRQVTVLGARDYGGQYQSLITRLDQSGATLHEEADTARATLIFGFPHFDFGQDNSFFLAYQHTSSAQAGNLYVRRQSYDQHIIWQREFDAGPHSSSRLAPTDICASSDGGVLILCDRYLNSSAPPSTYIMKLDPEGELQWHRSVDSGVAWRGYTVRIREMEDGGYVGTGYDRRLGIANGEIFVFCLAGNGEVMWLQRYRSRDTLRSVPEDIIATGDGGFLIAGYCSDGSGDFDFYALKLNANGDRVWEEQWGTTRDDYLSVAMENGKDGYLVAGRSDSAMFIGALADPSTGVRHPARGEEKFLFWPNPARDFLEIRLGGDAPALVELLDLNGRVWRSAQTEQAALSFHLRGLAAGVYMLRVRSDRGSAGHRVIILP